MQSAGFPDGIVKPSRRPSRWVVAARMRALGPLVEPVPSPAEVEVVAKSLVGVAWALV